MKPNKEIVQDIKLIGLKKFRNKMKQEAIQFGNYLKAAQIFLMQILILQILKPCLKYIQQKI